MSEPATTIELRHDQILGLYAHLDPALADAVTDYFEECRMPLVRDFPGAARLAHEGRVTVIFPGARRDVRTHLREYGAKVTEPAARAEPENRRYAPPVDALLAIGSPYPSDHKGERRVLPEFTPANVPDLLQMATDDELHRAPAITTAVWAPMHAIRALGNLRAVEATDPLLAQLRRIDEDEDDYVGDEVIHALAAIGPAVVEPVARYLADASHGLRARGSAARTLRLIGMNLPDARVACVDPLTRQLSLCAEQDPGLNGMLVADLLDLRAVESAAVIERAFAGGHVDESVAGDWEDVQIEFGFKARREHPRKSNELTEWSQKFRAVLGLPELDPLAGPGELAKAAENFAWPKRKEPPPPILEKPAPVRVAPKTGRNDPCPCGSGKKFKKCCGC